MASEEIVATFRVVTPMFCGGAANEGAEFRIPSFKGVLRWWWRALAWSRCGGRLEEIRRAEARIFGSADGGQSRVLLRVTRSTAPKPTAKGTVLKSGDREVGQGARYLGYGVMEAFQSSVKGTEAGELTRGCLAAPFEVEVAFRCRDLAPADREGLLRALRALGLLGGMGTKSRKGYGSLVLRKLEGPKVQWSAPSSTDELARCIRDLYAPGPPGLPAYTALSSRSRHVLVEGTGRPSALDLLDRVGREMVRYRSWGHQGKVLGVEAERRFKRDHDQIKAADRRAPHHFHPERIAFGLPHNGGKLQVKPEAKPHVGDRRASPLLIHIHECGDRPVAVLSFLPADFLPPGTRVDVGGNKVPLQPDPEFWEPVESFLNRLLTNPVEPFGRALEVKP
jgi:CRISPR-associated protein Cmr1